MLVLSRKVGERLVIGENISVVVSKVAGNRVTLAIEAPPSVRIVRGELPPANTEKLASNSARENNGRPEAPALAPVRDRVATPPLTVAPAVAATLGCS